MSTAAAIADLRRTYAAFTAAAEALHHSLLAEAGALEDGTDYGILRTIQASVALHFGTTVAKLISPDRHREITTARQIAMVLCREETGCTVEYIGRAFRRDHGTITHACQAVTARCQTEPVFARQFTIIQAKVVQAIEAHHPHA